MKKYILIFLIIQFNISFGQITFQKTFGGSSGDGGYSVEQTKDGGYILGGVSSSFGGCYLIKTGVYGDTLWTKGYSTLTGGDCRAVHQTMDNGYILTGSSSMIGSDILLIKTDSSGNVMWSQEFGGTGLDIACSGIQTLDTGYIICGYTQSFGSGMRDVYLIKTNSLGDILWSTTYGGTNTDGGISIAQTTDSGYIVSGYTYGFGAGAEDIYLLKIDGSGNILWSNTYGGAISDEGGEVHQTPDGGFIIVATSSSFGNNTNNVLLIKTNSIGDTLWTKRYGGDNYYWSQSMKQTKDTSYIVAGILLDSLTGLYFHYLLKVDFLGNVLWTKSYNLGDGMCTSVNEVDDGGYIMTGWSDTIIAVNDDIYFIKTDSIGNSGCNDNNYLTVSASVPLQITQPATAVFYPNTSVTSPVLNVISGGVVTDICSLVGIQSPNIYKSEMILYPNPAVNGFTIKNISSNISILKIVNLMGEVVYTEKLIGNEEYFINEKFTRGVYFVMVNDVVKKLIVE